MITKFSPLLLCLTFGLIVPYCACAQMLASAELPEAPVPQTAADGVAGQSSSAPTGQSSSSTGNANAKPAQTPQPDQLKTEEKQRLLGIVPAFNSVQSGEAAPLRPSQKIDLWFHSAIDPFTFGVAAIDAGIEQAQNTYPEYHQGFEGYAKRFGASYADSVDGNFWGNAILPIILHQDPRYFRLGHGTIKRRLGYAVLSTVRCKGDNGKWQPSYSNIGGNLIGGAISNVYYPASNRGVGLTLERGFTVTAEGAIGSLAYEFYPDLVGYLKHRHHPDAASTTPSPAADSTPNTPPAQ